MAARSRRSDVPKLSLAVGLAAAAAVSQEVAKPPFPTERAEWTIRGKVRSAVLLPARKLQLPPRARKLYPDGLPDEDRLAGVLDHTLPNAFIWVDGLEQRWTFPAPEEPLPVRVEGGRFVPHVIATQAPRKLRLTNGLAQRLDWSFISPKSIWGRSPAPNEVFEFTIRGSGFFYSNTHPWLFARVHVRPHPFVTVTDGEGRFVLPPLPEGEYEIGAAHELLGERRVRLVLDGAKPKPLTFVFAPDPKGKMTEGARKKLRRDVERLHQGASLYRARNRSWPRLPDALRYDGMRHYVGSDAIPRDPWGRPYRFRVAGARLVVASSGPDGFPGTADDIESGPPEKKPKKR